MDNNTIANILKRDPYTKHSFKGVYPSDRCPRTLKRGSCYVVNTDPTQYPGRHWVCIYVPEGKGAVEYFDSYGRPPTTIPGIARVLRNARYNTKQIQSLYSDVCGHHCIYYLLNKCRGKSMGTIVSRFTNDLRRNDKNVKRALKNVFKVL
jgi:hypothetical protein